MKIAIINILKSGISGGYIKYLRNLISSFEVNNDIDSVLIVFPEFLKDFELNNKKTKIKFEYQDFNPFFPKITTKVKELLDNFLPDIIFVPTERYLRYKNIPTVSMLQNMEPFTKKDNLNSIYLNIKQEILKRIGINSLKKSDGIIAISDFVNSYLKNKIQIAPEKIRIIKYGIDKPLTEIKPEGLPDNLNKNFIFTAGSIRPARGLIDLINAMVILKTKKVKTPLIIAGDNMREAKYYKQYLLKIIKKEGLDNQIYWMGKLNQNNMSWLYKNCKTFVMTSRVESFGMIAGEAMAHGCISISANNPCLPEIFETSALYYQPGNSNELANRILNVLSMTFETCEQFSIQAINYAGKYSWDTCTDNTISFMKYIINNKIQL